MTDIILLTGFLGAGKTTLLNRLLTGNENPGKTIGVIVNEFSQTGLDGQIIEAPSGTSLVELNNGSIFCACIKDHFVDALIDLSGRGLDLLFIEASGLADPANFTAILDGIKKQTKDAYRYLGGVCLVDALYFPKFFSLLPALKRQLLYSKVVLINKADLVEPAQIAQCLDLIRETNPAAAVYETSYCRIAFDQLYQDLAPSRDETEAGEGTAATGRPALDSTNTPETRPKTLTIHPAKAIEMTQLKALLSGLTPHAYRIKGFMMTTEGPCFVSCVGEEINIQPVEKMGGEASLVVIASVGIKIISLATAEARKYWGDNVQIRVD